MDRRQQPERTNGIVSVSPPSSLSPTPFPSAPLLPTIVGRHIREVLIGQLPQHVRRQPPGVRRVAVEAGATMSWYKYVGLEGAVVGLDRFGESAPGPAVMKYFGLTAEHVAEVAAG